MMDSTDKEQCVLCDKGGKLLVCSGNGCPISVHKDCMGCSPRFDESGNFLCPYCVYRHLTTEASQLRDKALLEKKALSSFLGENISSHGNNNQNPKDDIQDDQIPNRNGDQCSGIDNDDDDDDDDDDGNTCKIMIVYDGDASKKKGMNDNGVKSGVNKDEEDVISSSVEKQVTQLNVKLPLIKGKRRVRWSEEEEDMLKEGVRKFSSKANKNLPWKKVLEFGHHVFDASRTPSDLKDKWRKMAK